MNEKRGKTGSKNGEQEAKEEWRIEVRKQQDGGKGEGKK